MGTVDSVLTPYTCVRGAARRARPASIRGYRVRQRHPRRTFSAVSSAGLSRRIRDNDQYRAAQVLARDRFRTDLWTTPRIAEVIHRKFGVRYHPTHVCRLLVDLGWSCQKPERRALERDEQAIADWKGPIWRTIKKKSAD